MRSEISQALTKNETLHDAIDKRKGAMPVSYEVTSRFKSRPMKTRNATLSTLTGMANKDLMLTGDNTSQMFSLPRSRQDYTKWEAVSSKAVNQQLTIPKNPSLSSRGFVPAMQRGRAKSSIMR